MNAFGRFVRRLGLVTALVWVIGAYPLYAWGGVDLMLAAVVSCAICAVNALVGGGIALWAMDKNQKIFLIGIFGGMGLRLFVVLAVFLTVLKLVELHVFGLTLWFFLFYILFQILEIYFFVGRPSGASRVNEGT